LPYCIPLKIKSTKVHLSPERLRFAFAFHRDVTFSLREKNLLPQTASGVEWPCNVGEKVLALVRVLEILFYRACMCACRDERNEALADTLLVYTNL
jgi:hypothetical protein